MHRVEPNTFMELDCFFVRQSLPEEIQRGALEAAVNLPFELRAGQIYPEKSEAFVWML
jgi:hypothetical protein